MNLGKHDQERLDSLKAIREEAAKLGDTPEGRQMRAMTMTFACMMIMFVVVFLFNLATGRGICDILTIPLAAFAGLAWAQYRETQERSMGWYAIVAAALAVVMFALHIAGIF